MRIEVLIQSETQQRLSDSTSWLRLAIRYQTCNSKIDSLGCLFAKEVLQQFNFVQKIMIYKFIGNGCLFKNC